ncbi:MarR family winged helix-turn-helix transcriptional regulator [Emcibacter sp.]|uniref:MarR family winged helix-turn-helix transcriptional regulator n=1 Tax=Emcibacter sp. TaxID=1979954 RepID=UPI002AA66A4D|nr:MarR family winged helix-turn-helix transcriptional regulator [Emcibacter sp.]
MKKAIGGSKNTSSPAILYCPEGRISSPVKKREGQDVVDLTTYIPYLLSSVNNVLSRGASQFYLEKFGIGIVEWRVISMLAIEPGIPAARICEVIGIDKAAASRALNQLQKLGYLVFKASKTDSRRKAWCLNTKGYKLHDRILEVALGREEKLIQDVSPEDLEIFLRVMRQMRQNVIKISSQNE